jgi:hypothetical protein
VNEHGDAPLQHPSLLAYQAVFAAIGNGRHLIAAQVLKGLNDGDLIELGLICQDVRTMIEADQRRRVKTRRPHHE